MPLAVVRSRALIGLESPEIEVEVQTAGGLPAFTIVGLPEASVRESRDRVRAAIIHSGFSFPAGRITVNLAPADLPKAGSRYDLAIAVGILAVTEGYDPELLKQYEFCAELSLTGALRSVRGVLPTAFAARKNGHRLIIAAEQEREVALVESADIAVANHLLEVTAELCGQQTLGAARRDSGRERTQSTLCLSEVRGQQQAKRALVIAAAGGHHLLMHGPPGSGKSMLAQRFPALLPDLEMDEWAEVASIQSISGKTSNIETGSLTRPYRDPHHSSSTAALVGGGSNPRPGEITLAHCGVLFLDELPEFARSVLESLREPLETGEVVVARAKAQTRFPAKFQLIAAMNPCPCGYQGDSQKACRCTEDQVAKYKNKLSGPLLDRIDLHVGVERLPTSELLHNERNGTSTAEARALINGARARQVQRAGKLNATLSANETQQYCGLAEAEKQLLVKAADRLGFSARASHRILRVARTIADFDAADNINQQHLAEALGFREAI